MYAENTEHIVKGKRRAVQTGRQSQGIRRTKDINIKTHSCSACKKGYSFIGLRKYSCCDYFSRGAISCKGYNDVDSTTIRTKAASSIDWSHTVGHSQHMARSAMTVILDARPMAARKDLTSQHGLSHSHRPAPAGNRWRSASPGHCCLRRGSAPETHPRCIHIY